jgi:tetratricopeptide (TPR) repeat protein
MPLSVLKAKHILLMVALVATVYSSAFAQNRKPPTIVTYSNPEIVVYQGDRIELVAEVTGDALTFRWMRFDDVVCKDALCKLDTSSWSLGEHKLTFIVFNSAGSQTVRYKIKVLARTENSRSVLVKPRIERTPKFIETIGGEDFYVESVRGIGYSYHHSKIQVVGDFRRQIFWNERLRSHPEGAIRFGLSTKEEHYLVPESQVGLYTTPNGRRGVQLQRGTLRSRNFAQEEPNWTITVSDWVQVDTDSKGDVIVALGKPQKGQVSITVLRGNARVILQPQALPDQTENKNIVRTITVPTGSQIVVSRISTNESLLQPYSKEISEVIVNSTPGWIDRKKFKRALPNESNTSIKDLLEASDYPLVIESLLGDGPSDASFDKSYALARAYQGVYLYKTATKHFQDALRINANHAESHFNLGLMALDREEYKEAIKEFNNADDKGFQQQQLLDYYRGIATERESRNFAARNYFTRSLWKAQNDDLANSSKEFLKDLRLRKKLDADLVAKGGIDNNPWHTSPDNTLPNQYTERKSPYYEASASVTYRAFEDEGAFLGAGLDISRRQYLKPEVKDISPIYQNFYLEMGLRFDSESEPKERYFAFKVRPAVGIDFMGDKRSFDHIGATVGIEIPILPLEPSLEFQTTQYLDPIPTVNELFDPVSQKPLYVPSERTNRLTHYGLGLNLIDNHSQTLNFGYFYETLHMRRVELYSDNFRRHKAVLRFQQGFNYRFYIVPEVQYWTTRYQDASPVRKDTRFTTNLKLRWHYIPALYQDLGMEYYSNSSDQKANVYTHSEFFTAFGISI